MTQELRDLTFRLAEHFIAPQGEGQWLGLRMMFLRFAGCPVGRTPTDADHNVELSRPYGEYSSTPFSIRDQLAIHPEHTVCQSAHGGLAFVCDTNYKPKETWTGDKLVAHARQERHICLTGGEPLARKGMPELIEGLLGPGGVHIVHIETSGTVPIPHHIGENSEVWVTCSPKIGYLPQNTRHVDQFKFVVTSNNEGHEIEKFLKAQDAEEDFCNIWLQPEAGLTGPSPESCKNVLRAQEYLASVGIHARAGIQLHKLYNTR